MKYLRHKEKGFLVPYTPSIESAEWEVYEEPGPHDEPEPPARKKPGPKPKTEQTE
jgi:hypothetical protein